MPDHMSPSASPVLSLANAPSANATAAVATPEALSGLLDVLRDLVREIESGRGKAADNPRAE